MLDEHPAAPWARTVPRPRLGSTRPPATSCGSPRRRPCWPSRSAPGWARWSPAPRSRASGRRSRPSSTRPSRWSSRGPVTVACVLVAGRDRGPGAEAAVADAGTTAKRRVHHPRAACSNETYATVTPRRGPTACSTSRSCSRTAPATIRSAPRSCSGDQRLTYAQVNAAANQVANLLVARGIRPGRQGGAVLPEPAVLPGDLLRHPQGRRGRGAAERAAQGARDRLPPERLGGEGVLLLPGHRRSCRWAPRVTPASARPTGASTSS